MKKREAPSFKAGDRVKCYTRSPPYTATVVEFDSLGMLKIHDDQDGYYWVHFKACRRLVKSERRRVWVAFRRDGALGTSCLERPAEPWAEGWSWIEFIEVRKKKE